MIPINTLTSTAVPSRLPNIDTDQIIPQAVPQAHRAHRLRRTSSSTTGAASRKARTPSKPDPSFVLNNPAYKGRKSSSPGATSVAAHRAKHRLSAQPVRLPRRHRPHLRRHLLLQRFCGKNGIILVRLGRRGRANPPRPQHSENPAHKLIINLEAQTVTERDQGFNAHFDIDSVPQILPAQGPRRHRWPNPPPRRRPRQVRVRPRQRILVHPQTRNRVLAAIPLHELSF